MRIERLTKIKKTEYLVKMDDKRQKFCKSKRNLRKIGAETERLPKKLVNKEDVIIDETRHCNILA